MVPARASNSPLFNVSPESQRGYPSVGLLSPLLLILIRHVHTWYLMVAIFLKHLILVTQDITATVLSAEAVRRSLLPVSA
jgi:hypothetical protein